MFRRSRLAIALVSVGVSITGIANAQEECPLGSSQKTESGSTWCEPSVCASDTNCPTGSICRPVALCVEIGTLDPKAADGGQRLLVRQRCGEAKSCPQKTTCSEATRCVTRAQAEKAGLLTPASAGGTPAEPAKKSCGCDLPGLASSPLSTTGTLALAVAALAFARRRARTTDGKRAL